VFTVSLATYTLRGAFADGANHLALIIPAITMAAVLGRLQVHARTQADAPTRS
jgi:hypothetical protein